MATVGNLLVLISASNAPLSAALAKSEGELKAFSATAGGHGATTAGHFHGIGVAALGVVGAVGIMGAAGIKAAGDFQEQMGIINTIAHQTPAELDKTGQSIRALSTSSGTGLTDLTKGFYDLLSAGVPAGQAMDALRQANTLAIGGLATTSQTVDLITTAINSYQLNTKGAAVATDQFALAVQDGKVTADQIATTFADVAPLAHTMGIGIDEISATYAVLTAKGVPAAEATTQMNRAMIELLKPNADLNALQKKTGENFADIARHKGLVVALQDMRDAAEANGVPFQNLFGRLEGMKFALATTGPNFQTYSDELTKMHGATGTAADQAAERMGTFDRQLSILGNSLQDLAIGVGNAFLPTLTGMVQQVSGVVQAISDWSDKNPGLAGTILAVVGGVAALIAGIVFVGPIIGAVAGAIAVLLSPIGAVIAAIALLVIAWQNNWLGIRDVVGSVIDAIAPIIGGIADLVSTIGFAIANGLDDGSVAAEAFREGPFGQLGGFVSDTVATIVGVVRTGLGAIGPIISGISSAIGTLMSAFNTGGLSGLGAAILPMFQQVASTVGGWISAQIPVLVGQLAQWGEAFIGWAAAAIPGALGALGQLSSDISGWIPAQVGGFVNLLASWREAFVGWIAPIAGNIVGELTSVGSAVGSWIVSQAPAWATMVTGWAQAFVGWAGPIVGEVIGQLSGFASAIGSWIVAQAPGWANQLLAWGEAFVGWATPMVGQLLSALGGAIGQAFSWVSAQAPGWISAFTGWVGPMILNLIGRLGDLAGQIVTWISAQLPGLTARLLTWVDAFVAWIGPTIPRVLGALAQLAVAFVSWIAPMIPLVIAGLAALGAQIVGWILRQIPVVAGALLGVAIEFVKWIAPKIPGLIVELGKLIVALVGAIVGAVPTIVTALLKWGVAMVGWVAGAAVQLLAALGGLLAQLLGWLAGVPAQVVSGATAIGKSIFDGIMAGIGDIGKAVGDKLNTIPGVSLVGGVGANAVGAVQGIGGAIGGAIPHFAMGGVVPGTGPQLAVVHGGETVVPPGGGAAQGGGVVEVHSHLHLDGREISEVVERHLFRNASTYSSGFLSNSGIVGA
jgi:TP901 family phage tail tape measure protein